jgi:opacity protein-like surface antigen
MKKILIPIVTVSALAAATLPAVASAQPINQRQHQMERRIDIGLRNGSLTRSEAYRLRAELRETERLEQRYRRGGLSGWERADLDRRFDRINAQIRYERHDRDYGYGYGDHRGPGRW